MSCIFGPVRSRRLGRSLGIDLLPFKTCNLDCIYCECGTTTEKTATRADRIENGTVIEELDLWLANHPAPDWITFAGSGEPLLHRSLGSLVRLIRERHPDMRLALLTNGLLLSDPEARRDACLFDLVLPSLDAALQESFATINRPLPGTLVSGYIEGLEKFRNEFSGSIWLEIFIVPGINDAPEDITALKNALARIRPERIQLNSLDRPGTVPGLEAATRTRLLELAAALERPNVEIISRANLSDAGTDVPEPEAEKRILVTVLRRPSTADDLALSSGLKPEQLELLLHDMLVRGQLVNRVIDGNLFYCRP